MSFENPATQTWCAWCAPDNRRVAKGSALTAKGPAGRPVYRRAPSCGLPGHGAHYQTGFIALNLQTLRAEHAANAYTEALPSWTFRGPEHVEAIEAALLAADAMERDPRLPTLRNYLTDPATSYRVKRAAELGARDAAALASSQGFHYLPSNVLQRAAEAALGYLMESLDVDKDPS